MNANLRVRAIVLHGDAVLLLPPDGSGEGGGCWTLPGGGLEAGETLAECAAREVREETGVAVAVGGVAFLRERPWTVRAPGVPDRGGLCLEITFHAAPAGGDIFPRAEAGCAIVPRWVSLTEAARLPLWPPELEAHVKALLPGPFAPDVVRHPAR